MRVLNYVINGWRCTRSSPPERIPQAWLPLQPPLMAKELFMKLRMIMMTCLLMPTLGWTADGQLTMPDFRGLAEKATDSVHISLGPWLLHTVGRFMDYDTHSDPDSAATKRLLSGIKSIEIHSFTFATDFAYSMADIDAVRRQLSAPGWSQLMQVRDGKKQENVDMYLMMDHNHTSGFALIASEPREFTIINIVGSFNPEDLPELQKQLHIHESKSGQARLLM